MFWLLVVNISSGKQDTMIIRPDYIIYAIFAYMSCASDAIIYSPIGRYKNTETKYQPGRALGEFFGSMILRGIKRNQMQQAELDPKDVGNVNPEYNNEYNKEPSLDGRYERPGNDNTTKTNDLDYNGRYDSRGYTHDDGRYQVNNDVPASRTHPDIPNNDLHYVLPPINARENTRRTVDKDPYPIRSVDGNDSGKSYRDPASDLRFGVDDRYQQDRDFVTNPNGTPNRVSEVGYESGIDINVPLEPLIPPQQEEIPEDEDMYGLKINNDNESGTVKALTVTAFTFQAQPIRPDNERNISMIAVYYID